MLLFIGLITFAVACDSLEPDTLLVDDNLKISDDPLIISAETSGIIDLATLIDASGAYRFTTSQPKFGTLESLGGSLLKYTSFDSIEVDRDGFKLTVFNESNVIVDEDSVIIIIPSDSTDIPCGVWALTDYVPNVDSSVVIDVLANDTACGIDKSMLQVSIATELDSAGTPIPPSYFGTLELLGNGRIRYTPGPSYPGEDKFIYKLTKPAGIPNESDAEVVSYGFVYLSGTPEDTIAHCDGFGLADDIYEFSVDSIEIAHRYYLPVTGNDVICESDISKIHFVLLDSINLGLVEYGPGLDFYYTLPDNASSGFVDEFRYEICANGMCGTATVTIKAK